MKTSFLILIKIVVVMMLVVFVSGCQKDPVTPISGNKPATHAVQSGTSTDPGGDTAHSVSKNTSAHSSLKSKTKLTNKTPSSQPSYQTNQAQADSKSASNKKVSSSNPKNPKQAASSPSKEASSKPSSTPNQKAQTQETVTISVIGYQGKAVIPSTHISIKQGESFLDATLQILKTRGIQYSVRGSGSTAYLEGINNTYEFDHGPKSGWIAKKNGSNLTKSAGVISLKAGDVIQWMYTTTGE